LPDGWRGRLVKVQNENTAAPSGEPQFIGWCLDKEDLCVAKLCAFREKDQNFVHALIAADLVDPEVIATRLAALPERYRRASERAAAWLAHHTNRAQ
jgi:Nucleotidyltransferase of unknown function (DUF6036)